MRQDHAKDVYRLYDLFIEEFLIKGNSILSINHKNILTESSIADCFVNYIKDPKRDGGNFDIKKSAQFENTNIETNLVFAHAEWLWAFSVDDISYNKKLSYTKNTTKLSDDKLVLNVYPRGFGSAGRWHTNNKYHEIVFSLVLIKLVFDLKNQGVVNNIQDVKNWIEAICLYKKDNIETENFIIPDEIKNLLPTNSLSLTNILTYTSNPDKYERIASNSHKNQIITSFWGLLDEEERKLTQDEKIFAIRKKLSEYTGKQNFDFYDNQFKQVWNYSLTQEGFSEIQGLQYKKAIILFGSPGTSKTYSALRLAKAFITHSYLKKSKKNVATYFKDNPNVTEKRIHHLQLHPNYTYEDFIAGYQLKNNETVKTKGTLFKICDEAREDDMPHILILDEINRIDLSRLFGEVFSALENREQEIEVGIGDLKLSIPKNLYVIGTMNEIDFSLERIDFALRRRFLWFNYGFNAEILRSIIVQKNWQKEKRKNIITKYNEIDRFIRNAENLNKEIAKIDELGKSYEIGHTFFAEIVDIFKSYMEIGGHGSLQNQIYRDSDGGAVKILWDISIEPMLQSFLGNTEEDRKNEILEQLRKIYYKG